jgi:serine/threonine protein phosphatase PrpC
VNTQELVLAAPRAADQERGAQLILGALTDRGQVKAFNQDSLFLFSSTLSQGEELAPAALAIVADGMGEDEPGTQASALAVRVVADRVLARIYRPLMLEVNPSSDRPAIHQMLRAAVAKAHERIRQSHPGGKTTLTCAFVLGGNAFVAHVGDSRAYLIEQETIRQVTTDHSLVNRLIEVGQITAQEALTHPQRNVLYRALGRDGEFQVDTYLEPVSSNSSLLLCSDGLWGEVSEETICAIVRSAPSPQSACRSLVARANENGGEDNITAVLIQIGQ